jgi:hypothetical protein
MAGVASSLFVENLPLDYETRYPDLIRTLPRERVEASARQIQANGLCVVLVGDRKKVEPNLVKHGYAVETAPPELSE